MVKVKAHTTLQDVAEGRITAWERRANGEIDGLAKKGAQVHKVPASVLLEIKAFNSLAMQAARWAGEAHVAAEKF